MKYLIDTDWIIHGLNGEEKVVNKLLKLRREGLTVSVISLAELYEGVYRSTDPVSNEKFLMDFLNGVSILGVTEEICRIFGKERGRLRQQGQTIGDLDLFIAATCLYYNLTLLTNNVAHFERIKKLEIISLLDNYGDLS